MKKPRILVTGASGFVGRAILRGLPMAEVDAIALVRPASKTPPEWQEHIERMEVADLFSAPAGYLTELLKGIDCVVHAAWYVEPGKYLQSHQNFDCLAGTLQLAQACAAAGVSRFVGIGTCFEYDVSQGHLSTSTPLNPQSPYAAAKASAYLSLREYFKLENVSFSWARLFYLHGMGEDPRRLVPYVHQQLARGLPVELTSGNQLRDFLDVDEAGRQIAALALGTRKDAVNICSGTGITVRQLVEAIADNYGRRDLLRFGARPDNFTDPPIVVGRHD